LAAAQSPTPVFKADANLQSIAVQVTDKQGRDVRGLSDADFTILEDGHPQKIAFFGAENQPISLVVLLDSSSSMDYSEKLARARTLLSPLLHGNLPADEIILAPFTDRVGTFQKLSADQRMHPPAVNVASMGGGTALYDALATALCHLQTAVNVRQAVVVITDGSDQHSRLKLEQLIHLAQSSRPQVFMIGFFDRSDYDSYRKSGKTVTLVSGHEIDNPLHVFDRIAKETGTESFFPASERDLQKVIGRILGILEGQYTLAYYPQDVRKFRRIQVKVKRGGVNVAARHSVGSEGGDGESVHFSSTSCEVSPKEHPYPWEAHVTESATHTMIYQDNFSDPQSGWPNHAGSRYAQGAYELSKSDSSTPSGAVSSINMTGTTVIAGSAGQSGQADGVVAAYGPWWEDFRASLSLEGAGSAARGMVFRLNDEGCYALLLSGTGKATGLSFKLVRSDFLSQREAPILPWTPISDAAIPPAGTESRIAVECRRERITILINGVQVASIKDTSFAGGYVGMAQYGFGRTFFRDLKVEGLP
jgi:Ca-activated chloride channel family protein